MQVPVGSLGISRDPQKEIIIGTLGIQKKEKRNKKENKFLGNKKSNKNPLGVPKRRFLFLGIQKKENKTVLKYLREVTKLVSTFTASSPQITDLQ